MEKEKLLQMLIITVLKASIDDSGNHKWLSASRIQRLLPYKAFYPNVVTAVNMLLLEGNIEKSMGASEMFKFKEWKLWEKNADATTVEQ